MTSTVNVEWVAVSDRLPSLAKDNYFQPQRILVAIQNGEVHEAIFVEIIGMPRFELCDLMIRQRLQDEKITHWALMPARPEMP